jgi:hypothetical protein
MVEALQGNLVKIVVGILVATGLAVSTGFAAAQHSSSQDLSGYTKDQCKNGGWAALGFKNQGQCVSYFASGGRAPGN